MNVKYIDNSGDTNWFEADGETYGVEDDGKICDFEGYPKSDEWYSENFYLASKLRDASFEQWGI